MVKLGDYEQQEWAAGRPYLSFNAETGEGVYRHPAGLVEITVFSHGSIRVTCLRAIRQGRTIMRRWETIWPERTLSRLCREFIEEVSAPPQGEK